MATNYLINGIELANIINSSIGPNPSYPSLLNGYTTNSTDIYYIPYPLPYSNFLYNPLNGPSIGCVTSQTNLQDNSTDLSQLCSPNQTYIYNSSKTYTYNTTVVVNTGCKYVYFIVIGSGGWGGIGNGNNGGSGGSGGSCWGYIDIRNWFGALITIEINYNTNSGTNNMNIVSFRSNGTEKAYVVAYNGGGGSQGGGGAAGNAVYSPISPSIMYATAVSGFSGSQSNLNPQPSGYNYYCSSNGLQSIPYPYSPSISLGYGDGGHGSNNQGQGQTNGNSGSIQLWYIY